MGKQFEVRWEGELAAGPQAVWDAFTVHCAGWLWPIEYAPEVGGSETGLTAGGGTVTVWEPGRHFATRAVSDDGGVNELDYVLEPGSSGTRLAYVHHGELDESDYDRRLDACEQHTAFYYHSMSEYVRHFSGRTARYVSVEAPGASAKGGSAAIRRALGLAADVAAGDEVRLAPSGPAPIQGTVDYATRAFVGIRSADALIRIYGRDEWDWPVSVAVHAFADGADPAAIEQSWTTWLNDMFAGKVA